MQSVREITSQLKAEAVKRQAELEQKNKEIQSSAAKTEKELREIIRKSRLILKTNNVDKILSYRSRNGSYMHDPKPIEHLPIRFVSGKMRQNKLHEMVGSLEILDQNAHSELKLMSNPVVLSTIESPFDKQDTEELWKILFEGKEKNLVSGDEKNIYIIDRRGTILKKICTAENVMSLALNTRKEISFTLKWPDTNMYIYDGNEVRTKFNLCQWCPRGICFAKNGDLLISMRSTDENNSRIVRYEGEMEIKVIQNDAQRQPPFSVEIKNVLMLTENGNRDICVADRAGEYFVVVDVAGELLFRYHGNISQQSKNSSFGPYEIASDVNHQIIINDALNDIVHIIDSEGRFLCYIEQKCNGGLCIDTDHNLIVGEEKTGYILIIKYLQ